MKNHHSHKKSSTSYIATMEAKQQSNAGAFGSSASTTSADDARAEQEILHGIRDALNREAKRRKIQLSPARYDELLEEAFPKMQDPEGEKAKELTMDEYVALRIGLQGVIQSEVKEKMTLLREQLSEYHSVLEDVIVFQSRCERLEQEKRDLVSLCRETCQVRDDKIALLEKEVSRLRNECRLRSSSCGSTDGIFSTIVGIGSEGQNLLHGQDHPQYYHHHTHPQEDFNHQHQPQQIPALTSRTPKMSDHYHQYYKDGAARMISSSPSSVPNSSNSSTDVFSVGAVHPLLFQEPSGPMFLQLMNQEGVVDDYPESARSNENRNKRSAGPS
jgi:hypothetical protein